LHDTQFRVAFWLPRFREYTPIALGAATLWELTFPLALFWTKVRWWYLGLGVLFHFASMVTMNIFFPNQLAMYLIFVDWPAVLEHVKRWPPFRILSTRWKRWGAVPETFPTLALPGLSKEGLLLCDEMNGANRYLLKGLQWLVREPFSVASHKSLQSSLPEVLAPWFSQQVHWITPEGAVFGGSQALTELLAAKGHPLLAGILESAVVSPWLWLGYRIFANGGSQRPK
jgi:hypothetical protein